MGRRIPAWRGNPSTGAARAIWFAPLAIAGAAALMSPTRLGPTVFAQSAQPTFNKDVAPILYANCVTCHRPGEMAPMPLLTLAQAKPFASAIKAAVDTRAMPPWFADPRYGEFKNNRTLTPAQIATVSAWVDGGAPEGDTPPPKAPSFQTGWNSRMDRPPDQVIELPQEFELPATGIVPVFTLWVKLPIREEKFIQAIELRPDNRHLVHHSSVSVGPLPAGTQVGKGAAWEGGPQFDGVPLHRDGRPFRAQGAESFGKPLLFYVPGGGFQQYPNGFGKRLRPDEYIAWGLHFMTTGKPEKTRLRLGLWYTRRNPHHEMYTWTVNQRRIVEGKELAPGAPVPNIPPRVDNWSMTGVLQIAQDITLYAMWPHMHFRGKDMTFVLTHPDGKEQTLLSVPKYNPHWQLTYELAKPIKIKARSTITAYGHYDNSPNNHHNPAPDEEVLFGEQGHNEMFIPFLEVTVDDEDLRFERLQEQLR